MKTTLNIIALALLFIVLHTRQILAAATVSPDLQIALGNMAKGERVAVIATLSDRVDLKSFKDKNKQLRRRKLLKALKSEADRGQKPLKRLLRRGGAQQIKALWAINAIAFEARAKTIKKLAQGNVFSFIGFDYILSAPVASYNAVVNPEWNIQAVGAQMLWGLGFNGQGVVVANMDTGVDLGHPDLATRWRGGSNSWLDVYNTYPQPTDTIGHGTQTMGLMVGGDSGGPAVGMAPGAQWIAVRIFDDLGQATLSGIHQGFQWLLDPDGDLATDDAPDIINNSWGFPTTVGTCYVEFADIIQVLQTAGIAVVFSAGNEGPAGSSDISPANNAASIAVGSVDDTWQISPSSSRGPSACDGGIFPQLVAPGVMVSTTDIFSLPGLPSYATVSGTSFAAPHISGTLALLAEAFPGLAMSELESAVEQSAVDLGGTGADNTYGLGMVDVLGAYELLSVIAPPDPDADGDGFAASVDCNDADASIYPGAVEIKHDLIDQDCNGYDLTIDIAAALYWTNQKLVVAASSDLNSGAGLDLLIELSDGSSVIRPMAWKVSRSRWEKVLVGVEDRFGAAPLTIVVKGIEGNETSLVTTRVADLDSDGDGFVASVDCNDSDPAIYPGALEIKHDLIDQDCNGYDLTIDIGHAIYWLGGQKIVTTATSSLGGGAGLELIVDFADGSAIVRAMNWNSTRNRWEKVMVGMENRFGAKPVTVTVSGVEGQVAAILTNK